MSVDARPTPTDHPAPQPNQHHPRRPAPRTPTRPDSRSTGPGTMKPLVAAAFPARTTSDRTAENRPFRRRCPYYCCGTGPARRSDRARSASSSRWETQTGGACPFQRTDPSTPRSPRKPPSHSPDQARRRRPNPPPANPGPTPASVHRRLCSRPEPVTDWSGRRCGPHRASLRVPPRGGGAPRPRRRPNTKRASPRRECGEGTRLSGRFRGLLL